MCLNLTDIIFSDGLETIGEQAFSYCYGLTEISLPESITTIGDYAFIYCNNLFKVTVPNNITYLGKTVFGACYNLSSFSGQYTTSDHRCLIVNGRLAAFAPKGLTEYTIPDGVTTIGDNVFFGCTNLTRITIPMELKP